MDEAIGRLKMQAVNRAFTKSVNRTVSYVDTLSLAAIAAVDQPMRIQVFTTPT